MVVCYSDEGCASPDRKNVGSPRPEMISDVCGPEGYTINTVDEYCEVCCCFVVGEF